MPNEENIDELCSLTTNLSITTEKSKKTRGTEKSKKTRGTAKKDEEMRLKLIYDNCNNNTPIGIKIKENYKKKFNKEIKEINITAKRTDHYDLQIIHIDGTIKKCEEKGTKTYHPNINQKNKKPWEYSVQIFNGYGDHFGVCHIFAKLWYKLYIEPDNINEKYNIETPIPSCEEWINTDAFSFDVKSKYAIELKKNFREIHGLTSLNGRSIKGFKPNNFDYRINFKNNFKKLFTDEIKKIMIEEVQEKFNKAFKEKECYLQTTGDIETDNFSFKWYEPIEPPKIKDIIMRNTGTDIDFDIIKENNKNIEYYEYWLKLRFGRGSGYSNIRLDFK